MKQMSKMRYMVTVSVVGTDHKISRKMRSGPGQEERLQEEEEQHRSDPRYNGEGILESLAKLLVKTEGLEVIRQDWNHNHEQEFGSGFYAAKQVMGRPVLKEVYKWFTSV